jgi:dTDP-4-dehydrorhamnose reductase
MRKRLLVVGGAGMLGHEIVKHFSQNDSYKVMSLQRNSEEIQFPNNVDVRSVDITDEPSFGEFLEISKPDLIINCAALVDLDLCESDFNLAIKVNCNTLKIIKEYSGKSKLVHISTDSVFNGTQGNYSETDSVDPLNNYAKSKYQGELAAMDIENSIIIRTNIFGFHHQKSKVSLAEWALENLTHEIKINGFGDVYFNPVYTGQLSLVIENLIGVDFSGLINVGSDEFISKFDFLKKLAGAHFLDPGLITAKSVSEMMFKAERPKNTTLNTGYLTKVLGVTPGLLEGLKMFFVDYVNFIKIKNEYNSN